MNSTTCSSPSSSGYGTLSKNLPNGKCLNKPNSVFGSAITMSKEDYERDRARWHQKLNDKATRLAEAEILISEMNQIKAELNKKIVEMERNQRPLIEQNRRLTERNRILQNEIKKSEQKLCHSQDDFLTLKDSYERLVKDNQLLKERRAFPEKLEELDRYRNQVLEYSKCITALRQSGLEKDRRYELLVQKFKRLRKCISTRKNGENEEDRQSSFGGSDCSAESSISLNTITEDLNEALDKDIENDYQQLAREREELKCTLSMLKSGDFTIEDEQFLRDQLICAQSTIAQQQMIIEQQNSQPEARIDMHGTINRLQDQIITLCSKIETLELELSKSKDTNELLEFQLLEIAENMKHEVEEKQTTGEMRDVSVLTDTVISDEDDCTFLSQLPALPNYDDICRHKREMIDLRRSASLSPSERHIVQDMLLYVDHLENKILGVKEKMETKMKQSALKEKENESKIQVLQEQINQSLVEKTEYNNLQAEMDLLRKKEHELEAEKLILYNDVNTMSKEMGKLRYLLQQKDEQCTQLNDEKQELQSNIDRLSRNNTTEADNLRNELMKCSTSLKSAQENFEMKNKETEELNKENARLQFEYSSALNEIQRLKDDIRPAVKTDLERRFEEYRYRLSCALETIHEYEDEISKLKSRVAELEMKIFSQTDAEKELEQYRDYTEQLQEQFAAQADIIDVLKHKIVQQKTFTDFISGIPENGEVSLAKIEDKLARYRLSQVDDASCQLTDAVRKLLRHISSNYGYNVLPSPLK